MIDFNAIAQIHLIKGAGGGNPRNGLCIMEMVSYFDGASRVTDHPECACLALTAFAIRLNDDAPSQADRDTLKPLAPLLAGTRSTEHTQARVEHLVRAVVNRIIAPVFDARWPQHAAALRKAQTMTKIADAANDAYAAANDADAANAAAYAAYAANAANAANADAAAYAAYAANAANANAAEAAANDAYAAAKRDVWQTQREILIEAIKLGPHGGLDVETYNQRAAELAKVLA